MNDPVAATDVSPDVGGIDNSSRSRPARNSGGRDDLRAAVAEAEQVFEMPSACPSGTEADQLKQPLWPKRQRPRSTGPSLANARRRISIARKPGGGNLVGISYTPILNWRNTRAWSFFM